MPIRAENRKLYPGGSPNSKEWRSIRAAILERANDRCEFCFAPNGIRVLRKGIEWRKESDPPAFSDEFWETDKPTRNVRVVLTIAHLDHDPTNNDPKNLRAFCQQCHNRHDAAHRAENRKNKESRK